MPGPLLETAPFQQADDDALAGLVATLRAALDPDAVDLEFRSLPAGRRWRRRLDPASPARSVRTLSEMKLLPPRGETGLEVPFRAPGVADGVLTLQRRRGRPWTGPERARFALLSPFVSLVLSGAARAEADRVSRDRLQAALEATDAPILLLDGAGTILFANEAADELLSRQTEEGLAVLGDDRRALPLVTRLIRIASSGDDEVRERLALTNGRSLDARVKTACLSGGPLRVVSLSERAALAIDDVRPLLVARGVSDREADVVAGVLRGLRNAEIASELFICEYTVKDHLKHVFGKIGVSSRGGLIRALYEARGTGGANGANGAQAPPR